MEEGSGMNARSMAALWGAAVLTIFARSGPAAAQPVQINFAANATTISGSPFGFTTTTGIQPITGFFIYNRATPDTNAATNRGDYPHTGGGGGFQAIVQN